MEDLSILDLTTTFARILRVTDERSCIDDPKTVEDHSSHDSPGANAVEHSRQGKEKGKNKNENPESKRVTVDTFTSRGKVDIEALNLYLNSVTDENDELREKTRQLSKELEQVKSNFQEVTDKMAMTYKRHNPGITESAGNQLNPSNIADMLQSIYDGVFQILVDSAKDERKAMGQLGKILKSTYSYCEERARMQIYQLLRPETLRTLKQSDSKSDDETKHVNWEETEIRNCLPEEECQEIYRLRFDIAQNADVLEHVKKKCSAFLSRNYNENEMLPIFRSSDDGSDTEDEDIYRDLTDFYDQCAKCCWLVATCRPPIKLQFCHEFSRFEGDLEKCFRVIDRDDCVCHTPNIVTQVIWPAVVQERKDKVGIYKEGYVYVNNEHPTKIGRRIRSQYTRSRNQRTKDGSDKETEIV